MDRTVDTHTLQIVVFRPGIFICHNITQRTDGGLCLVGQRSRGCIVALRL